MKVTKVDLLKLGVKKHHSHFYPCEHSEAESHMSNLRTGQQCTMQISITTPISFSPLYFLLFQSLPFFLFQTAFNRVLTFFLL